MASAFDDRVPFLLRMAGRPHVFMILELLSGQGSKNARELSESINLSLAYTQCLLSQSTRAGLLERQSLEHQESEESVGRKPYVYHTTADVEEWLSATKQLLCREAP